MRERIRRAYPLRFAGLARLCQWFGFIREKRIENRRGGLLDYGK